MPPRLALTAEQALERIREQTRLRVKRYRERRNAALNKGGSVTAHQGGHVTPPPSRTLPSPALSTTERLLERLAPFASRSFRPDPAFLALLAERYPGVDLELELAAALDWLEEPRHAKRRCSKGFLANWVKKADADRTAREALPPATAARTNGYAAAGQYVQPQSQQHNRHPEHVPLLSGPLERIGPAEMRRALEDRARVPLEVKLAAAKNGTSPGGRHA